MAHPIRRRARIAASVAALTVVAASALLPQSAEAAPDVTTRQAYSFFDGQACIAGKCAPVGQARLWYDSWDKQGKDLRRVQLNWFSYRRPCNTWVDFDATSTDGTRRLWHSQGVTQAGCRFRDAAATETVGAGTVVITEDTATVCGTVFRAGSPSPELVTRVCVYVG